MDVQTTTMRGDEDTTIVPVRSGRNRRCFSDQSLEKPDLGQQRGAEPPCLVFQFWMPWCRERAELSTQWPVLVDWRGVQVWRTGEKPYRLQFRTLFLYGSTQCPCLECLETPMSSPPLYGSEDMDVSEHSRYKYWLCYHYFYWRRKSMDFNTLLQSRLLTRQHKYINHKRQYNNEAEK